MNLDDFLADGDNLHSQQGNPGVRCNALGKTANAINCLLTPSQAMQLAQNLLQKAQLILDTRLEDAAVHLWNAGANNETLLCGLNRARKGPRRKKPVKKS